jgi:hypothetical protein
MCAFHQKWWRISNGRFMTRKLVIDGDEEGENGQISLSWRSGAAKKKRNVASNIA